MHGKIYVIYRDGAYSIKDIFIFASSTFRLLMAPAIASAEPFVSVLIMRFTEGLAESPAPAKIPPN